MDSQLLTGVVLIVAGIALGLLAYAIVLNRKERAAPDAQSAEQAEVPEPPASSVPATPPGSAAPAATAVPPPTVSGASAPRRLVPVAEVLRDERTDALILRVGEREYSSAEELRTSGDWSRVELAAADLQSWLTEAGPPDRSREPVRKEGLPRPHTMIDQINEILTRKLDAAGAAPRAVRLIDGGGGAVHVYVGLQRYEMDTVPDEDVRRLIREAVAEWEARQ